MIGSPAQIPLSEVDRKLTVEAGRIEPHGQRPDATDAEVEAAIHDELIEAIMRESPPIYKPKPGRPRRRRDTES